MYVLDTDYVVLLPPRDWKRTAPFVQRMALHADTDFFYPIIAFHEQMLGANAYISRQHETETICARLRHVAVRVLADFSLAQVLPFDDPAARKFDELRSQRVRIGTMDLRIAVCVGITKRRSLLAIANILTAGLETSIVGGIPLGCGRPR